MVASTIATEPVPEKIIRASNALQILRWGRVRTEAILERLPGMELRRTHADARRKLGRPEANDRDLLIEIEQRRRAQGCSQRKAIIEVLDGLPCLGMDRKGGSTVRMPDGRCISRFSALKSLERKMRKHRTNIRIRADAIEWGHEIARKEFEWLAAQRGLGLQGGAAKPSLSEKDFPKWAMRVAIKAYDLETSRLLRKKSGVRPNFPLLAALPARRRDRAEERGSPWCRRVAGATFASRSPCPWRSRAR